MLRRVYWTLLSVACLGLDYLIGPAVQFPFFYLVPIGLASWFEGFQWGAALAVVLPAARFALHMAWDDGWTWAVFANAAIRISVFATFAWLAARTAEQMRQLRNAVHRNEFERELCANCRERLTQVFDRR